MSTPHKVLTGLAAFALVTGVGMAQSKKQSANRLGADSTFVTKAAMGNMAEVQMGQLAVQHASNPQVKQFGQRMIDDHSKANDELKKIASQKGETMPTTIDAKDKATIDRLSKLNGMQFDRAYMDDMVKDHRNDIAEFRRESQSGDDTDLKAFASQTLPTLQDHLKSAEETQKELKK